MHTVHTQLCETIIQGNNSQMEQNEEEEKAIHDKEEVVYIQNVSNEKFDQSFLFGCIHLYYFISGIRDSGVLERFDDPRIE